jgi:hypothetical protein
MLKKNDFRLIMISAMYENGGNTTQRFLDGHPNLYVYPFESQLGTFLTADNFTSFMPVKYRWPQLPLVGDFESDYELIIDEEMKVRLNTQYVSKFRDVDMQLTNAGRKKIFLQLLKNKPRTRANVVEAFFRSTFMAWKNYHASGKETTYVGYSPNVGIDAEKIFSDFPTAHVIHVVRNPYSAYADTKKRPVPYSIQRYMNTWNIMQFVSLNFAHMYPKNYHIIRFEDLVANKKTFFSSLMKKLHLSYADTLNYPSWHSKKLDDIVPWGTIRIPTTKSNMETMKELSQKEYRQIKSQTSVVSKLLGYDSL